MIIATATLIIGIICGCAMVIRNHAPDLIEDWCDEHEPNNGR